METNVVPLDDLGERRTNYESVGSALADLLLVAAEIAFVARETEEQDASRLFTKVLEAVREYEACSCEPEGSPEGAPVN